MTFRQTALDVMDHYRWAWRGRKYVDFGWAFVVVMWTAITVLLPPAVVASLSEQRKGRP